jgi:hypothetical protein
VQVDVAALQRENAERVRSAMLATNWQLVAEIAKLNDRVAELLAIAQRKQRKPAGSPTERKPEPPPSLATDQQKAFDARPKPPMSCRPSRSPPKEEQRRPAATAVPQHLEAEEHDSCDPRAVRTAARARSMWSMRSSKRSSMS